MSSPAAGEAAAAVITAVGVKLSDFWTDDPNMWFQHAEAQFIDARITVSSTKYYKVLGKLPAVVLKSVRDVVLGITATTADPYKQLKRRLVKSFAPSKWQQIFLLLHHPDIGDRRPSHLMDAMLALLPEGETPGLIFQGLFLERLPQDMRDHLTTRKFDDVRAMSDHADALWDGRQARAVSSVVAAVNTRSASPARSNRRQPRRRAATPGPSTGGDGLCFYHGRFGASAHRCEQPCSWSGNAPAAGGN